MTIDKLTAALKEAAEAHHVYEKANFPEGTTDQNWAGWYAAYIINKYGPLREAETVGDDASANAEKVFLRNHRAYAEKVSNLLRNHRVGSFRR